MRVLFVNPNYRDVPNLIPLGIGYIGSVLRQHGHQVQVLDCNGFQYSREETAKKIFEYEYDALGIGGLTTTYGFVKWLSKLVRSQRPEVPIFAGNMVSTAHPRPLLESSDVDIAVIDEGEITTVELIESFEGKRPLDSVAGIWYKKEGQILQTACRPRIKDIDSLPFPAWDLFPIDIYIRNPIYGEYGRKSLNVSTVRGCPYRCNFCSRPYGRIVTHRSPESIVLEMEELNKRYGANHIAFSDDLSFFSQKHMYGVCEAIMKAGLHKKMTWNCAARINLVDYPIVKRMKSAGCIRVGYGLESASPRILEIMHKNNTIELMEKGIEATRKAKLDFICSFMVGALGETEETVQETVDFIKRMRLTNDKFFFATPYPGTELYDYARAQGRIKVKEDSYIEQLGEMAETMLVNVSDMSDDELIQVKLEAEEQCRRLRTWDARFRIFMREWHRRFGQLKITLEFEGPAALIKEIAIRLVRKVGLYKKRTKPRQIRRYIPRADLSEVTFNA